MYYYLQTLTARVFDASMFAIKPILINNANELT